jgi:hypothetical protein
MKKEFSFKDPIEAAQFKEKSISKNLEINSKNIVPSQKSIRSHTSES